MKILLGCYDIAHLMSVYAKGLRQLNHHVDVVSIVQHPFYDESYPNMSNIYAQGVQILQSHLDEEKNIAPYLDIELLNKLGKLIQHLKSYDIFIFTNCISFFPGNLDYPILHKWGKKIVTMFSGSEIRSPSIAQQMWNDYGFKFPFSESNFENKLSILELYCKEVYFDNIGKKLLNVLMAELYSHVRLSVPEQSGLQHAPYNAYIHGVDNDQIISHIPNRKVPKVCHIPSNPQIKKTSYIQKILNELLNEGYAFTPVIKSRIKHKEVLQILSDSDILIDQMSIFPALLAHEGMASGCVVLTGNHPAGMPIPLKENECPVININEQNLKSVLIELLTNQSLRKILAEWSLKYVQDNVTPIKCAKRLINLIQNPIPLDYYPLYMFVSDIKLDNLEQPVIELLQNLRYDVLQKHGVPNQKVNELIKQSFPFSKQVSFPLWNTKLIHRGAWTYTRET
jgi:glycosyltransferase involved in cell wall biosynthesis